MDSSVGMRSFNHRVWIVTFCGGDWKCAYPFPCLSMLLKNGSGHCYSRMLLRVPWGNHASHTIRVGSVYRAGWVKEGESQGLSPVVLLAHSPAEAEVMTSIIPMNTCILHGSGMTATCLDWVLSIIKITPVPRNECNYVLHWRERASLIHHCMLEYHQLSLSALEWYS